MDTIRRSTVNAAKFVSRPANCVRAIVPGPSRSQCVATLFTQGFSGPAVQLLEGAEGRRILDVAGRHHGIRGRIVRLYQSGGAEGNELQTMDAALKNGHAVFIVAVSGFDEMLAAGRTLLDCGGHRAFYYDKRGSQLLD
ncbi:MAG: hypothetical protein JWN61_1783 [Pseudonocardiales bacterium]|nr:hypothetical protein [Pseudonocardiales bacterium]